MKRGLYLAPFDELADPRLLADLAGAAESVGWDGLFPIELPGPEGLAELADEVRQARAGSDGPFDLVVEVAPGADVRPWEAAGATWALTSIDPDPQPPAAEVRAMVEAGP